MEIAIIGTGQVAERNYIPSLLRHPDVSLTCYSRTAEKAAAMGRKFDARIAGTLEELFRRAPEAVFVLTRETDRFEATKSLFPYKPKRIFFEKPLVAKGGQAHVVPQDFEDAKSLLLTAKEIGCETAMVFNYRFFDQTQRARRLIQERNWGSLINVAALTHFACWSHCIDLILEFGGPVRELSAQQGSQLRPFEDGRVADRAVSFLIGAQGTGSLVGTAGMQWDFPLFELILNFEGGRVHFRGLDEEMEVLDYSRDAHEVLAPRRAGSRWVKYDESFDKSISAYLASIRQGTPPPVPGLAGLLELQFEASLFKSLAERRPVVPSVDFPIEPLR